MDLVHKSLFSSATIEWLTPPEIYKPLDDHYHFTTDPCTTPDNPLGCKIFFTKEQDGLAHFSEWSDNVFINPPYGREIGAWVRAGSYYAEVGRGNVVMLLPVRPDTRWWHESIGENPFYCDVRFLKGRIKFINKEKGRYAAPFPSAIITFRSD